MKKGYEIELSNGKIIQFVPAAGAANCAASYGDTKIEIETATGSFRVSSPTSKTLSDIATIVRFEHKEFELVDSATVDDTLVKTHVGMMACHMCNGWQCCATNGCVNCGCGWICG